MTSGRDHPDPASFSNFDQVVSEHLHFDWRVDFDSRIISGSVVHTLKAVEDVDTIVLDTSYLDISKIELDGNVISDVRPRLSLPGLSSVI